MRACSDRFRQSAAVARQHRDPIEHRLPRDAACVLHERWHQNQLRRREKPPRIGRIRPHRQVLQAGQVDAQRQKRTRLRFAFDQQQRDVRPALRQDLGNPRKDVYALPRHRVDECNKVPLSLRESVRVRAFRASFDFHPLRIEYQRQQLAIESELLAVIGPRELRGHDHAVRRREKPAIAVGEIVQLKQKRDAQPPHDPVQQARHLIAAVGPNQVGALSCSKRCCTP